MQRPWEKEFDEMIAKAARLAESEAHHMTGQGRWEDLYLYRRPGDLRATSYELGAPWELSGLCIHAGIPYADYARLIRDASRRLPILTAV